MSNPAAVQASSSANPRPHPVVKFFQYDDMEYTVIHPSDVDYLPALPNSEPERSLSGRQLRRPIWLVENCPELAYMLKHYDTESAFMASLQINPKNVAVVRQEKGWVLDPTIVARWQRLENALLWVCKRLFDSVVRPSEYCFGLASFWPTPTECGYKAAWPDERAARSAAYRSLDASRVLIARCSMAIALATSDPAAQPPRWVEVLLRYDIDPNWLDVFRQSPVGNLSPGMRVGAYINPSVDEYGNKWVNHIPCMIRANVPVHIAWPRTGRREIVAKYPFLREYLPVPVLTVQVSSLAKGEFRNVFRWDRVTAASSTTFVPDTSKTSPKIPHGPGQLPGESAEAFFARRDADDRQREANESPNARAARLARQKHAESFARPTRRSRTTIFFWTTISEVSGIGGDIPDEWLDLDYREVLGHERGGQAWQLHPDSHKRYNAFLDEWDICDKLAPTTQPLDVHEYDYGDDDDDFDLYASSPQRQSIPPPEVLDNTIMAQSFRTDLETLYEEQDAAYVPFVEHLAVVARKRLGVTARVVPDPSIPYNRYSALDVVRMLGYFQTDLPDTDPLVQALSALIASLLIDEKKPHASGVIWDLSSTSSEYLLRNPHPSMKISQVILNRSTWYRIHYNVAGEDQCWWEIVLQSAAAVLELYRHHEINTSLAATEFLALRGMPFNTIFAPREFRLARVHVALGYRRHDAKFDYDDYRTYEYRLRSFLSRPKARAAILQGGIVWRLALEVLPGDWIAAASHGPSPDAEEFAATFRPPRGVDYIDDGLSPQELDFICGVYQVYNEDYTQTADVSWWPRAHIWKGSHYDRGHWTPWSEKWFLTRLGNIRSGRADMHSTTKWKSSLRQTPSPGKFNKAVELSAQQFVCDRMKVPLVDISDR